MRVSKMVPHDLQSMSVDELWSVHELVASVLARKLSDEKARLDHRLRQLGLNRADGPKDVSRARRPYPRVFRNTEIRSSRRKRGPGAASNRAGSPLRSGPGDAWRISGFSRTRRRHHVIVGSVDRRAVSQDALD